MDGERVPEFRAVFSARVGDGVLDGDKFGGVNLGRFTGDPDGVGEA